MVRCALVCITKNEKRYMEEYILYYLKMGFASIFLYDNSPNRELLPLANKYPRLKIIWYPGTARQIPAYNHFLLYHKKSFDYVAFFDSDEFLVLKKHSSIADFCVDMIPSGAIGINWYIFGNNGNTRYSPEWVIRRFTKRSKQMNPLVKTIVKCSDIQQMEIHIPAKMIRGPIINCRKNVITGPNNYDFDDSIAQINHYCTKSDEEYNWKIQRGRAAIGQKRNHSDLVPYLSLNHVEDTSAVDFFDSREKNQLAVVVFVENQTQAENTFNLWVNSCHALFLYHPSEILIHLETALLQPSTRLEYQQDFLTFKKNSFRYFLFIEPEMKLKLPDGFQDLLSFCRFHIYKNGIFKLDKTILANCQDVLECKDFVIQKIGFGQKVKETSLIQLDKCLPSIGDEKLSC